MKLSWIIFVFLTVGFSSAKALTLNCRFVLTAEYTCEISGINLSENDAANVVIGGQHLPGRSNIDVREVRIFNSNIPIILNQLFTTFTNLDQMTISSSGLARIQTGAFDGAQRLTILLVLFNRQLRTIQPNAFVGASALTNIDLGENEIDTIHESAFNGLMSLRFLLLDNNKISQIPFNVFQPLPLVEVIVLDHNLLTSLSGRIFSNNPRISQINISDNRINAIGSSFLDGLSGLTSLFANNNTCVDSSWRIVGSVTIDTIRLGLAWCFNNDGDEKQPDELRRFILELRGPFSLRFENGTEIVRV